MFIINNKKEFLLTYATDYNGCLKDIDIANFLKFNLQNVFDYIISKETGHEEGDKHDHFHVYLKYIGKNKRGFSAQGKNAENTFDVPIQSYTENNIVRLPINVKGDMCTHAHPNIKFKGDKEDKNCKNSFAMVDYVTKQRKTLPPEEWRINSNFDWEEYLNDLSAKYNKEKEKSIRVKLTEKEMEFCEWLRNIINEHPEKTKNEIKSEIFKNKDYSFIFMSKNYNYDGLLSRYFKEKPEVKPPPYWGIFWIPVELKNALDYLNNFVKMWFNKEIPRGSRPKPIFLSGDGNCGKTSLFACMGTFSYWCTSWNFNNYRSSDSFNFFDDYDGNEDAKNNSSDNAWSYLKPWVGGQDTVSISGKYKQPENVRNNRPCIFVSNYKFNERFDEKAQKYWRDMNAFIIDLPTGEDLKTTKDRRTIGGFAKWVPYDTRDNWYYRNILHPEMVETVIIDDDKGKEPEASGYIEEENKRSFIIIDSDEEPFNTQGTTGRPNKKRRLTNPFAVDDKGTTSEHKKSTFDLSRMFKLDKRS